MKFRLLLVLMFLFILTAVVHIASAQDDERRRDDDEKTEQVELFSPRSQDGFDLTSSDDGMLEYECFGYYCVCLGTSDCDKMKANVCTEGTYEGTDSSGSCYSD